MACRIDDRRLAKHLATRPPRTTYLSCLAQCSQGSSCGAPDKWVNRLVVSVPISGNPTYSSCYNTLGASISSFGDSPNAWCSPAQFGIRFCH